MLLTLYTRCVSAHSAASFLNCEGWTLELSSPVVLSSISSSTEVFGSSRYLPLRSSAPSISLVFISTPSSPASMTLRPLIWFSGSWGEVEVPGIWDHHVEFLDLKRARIRIFEGGVC